MTDLITAPALGIKLGVCRETIRKLCAAAKVDETGVDGSSLYREEDAVAIYLEFRRGIGARKKAAVISRRLDRERYAGSGDEERGIPPGVVTEADMVEWNVCHPFRREIVERVVCCFRDLDNPPDRGWCHPQRIVK
ncbi:MAG: hypothetical protein AB7F40_11435 [Victivallaceae bacterium]